MPQRALHAFGVFCAAIQTTVSHLITSPATLPRARPTAYPGIGVGADDLFGQLPGHQLFRRSVNACDQLDGFRCSTGTCFTDSTGLIGCCDVASCAPRTICLAYTSGVTSPCDINTGGCTYCSDPATPSCLTITNTVASQWIHYCDTYASTETLGFANSFTTGSQANAQVVPTASSSTSSSSLSQNFTPQPSMCEQPPCSVSESSSTSTTAVATSFPDFTYSAASSATDSGSTDAGGATSTQSGVTATLYAGSNATVTSASDAGSTTDPHSSKSMSRGVVAGIICGAAAAIALVGAALWYTRKHWLTCLYPQTYDRGASTFHEKQRHDSGNMGKGMLAPTQANTPASPIKHYSPDDFSSQPELEGRQITSASPRPIIDTTVRGLGIGDYSPQRYAPTNPDPLSATDEGSPTDYIAPLTVRSVRPGVSEAPTDRPLPASPPVSSLAPPDTPHTNSSSPAGSNGPVSPITPTYYRYTPYTPSAYGGGDEPPSSVARTVSTAPPSLPQDYSAVSLGSTSNIYRGLSKSHSGRAPWAYLSPENAVSGGWRNEEGEL